MSQWYIIQVTVGREQKLAQQIKQRMEGLFPGKVKDVMVPVEKVITVNGREKVETQKPFFSGYVYIKVDMDEYIQKAVVSINGVKSFLGGVTPIPLQDKEINEILDRIENSDKNPQLSVKFEVGEQVRVREGPFASMVGSIDEIDIDDDRVVVSVPIFGRPTPVQLDTSAIEKV